MSYQREFGYIVNAVYRKGYLKNALAFSGSLQMDALYYLAADCEAAEAALAEEAAAGAGVDAVAATGLTAPFGWDLPHT